MAILNAEAVQGRSHFACVDRNLVVFFNFYFNKPRRIARGILDVSSQKNSSLFLIRLDDVELKLFLLAADSDEVQGLDACLGCPSSDHKSYTSASHTSSAPSLGMIGDQEKINAVV